MKIKIIIYSFLALYFSSCSNDKNLIRYVDPFIGSDAHGHVFVGANVPFGGVQVGPANFHKGWDWTSSYHYSDSIIKGFGHLKLSGTGIGDLGEILLMPANGDVLLTPVFNDYENGYASKYSKTDEYVSPGYYNVLLKKYNIRAELTATKRSGLHRYTFPKSSKSRVIINLEEGNGWDIPTETFLEKINDTIFHGYRFSKGWANDQKEFFSMIISKPVDKFFIVNQDSVYDKSKKKGKGVIGFLEFSTEENEQVFAKVGISPVSIKNAHENLMYEIKSWDFEKIKLSAEKAWNHELSKVEIKTEDDSKKKVFYTAMYHSMITPNLYHDINGDYRGADKKIYNDSSFTNYTLFSLWDTYRAAHPLYTILHTERVDDMITSMFKIYEHQGKLPIWHLRANETNTMVGYSAVPVLVDAAFKNLTSISDQSIFKSIKESSSKYFEPGIKEILELGYIPADYMVESVAKQMEYSISDWGIAQLAKKIGNNEDYEHYNDRAFNYKKYFDSETKFFRGKLSDGSWRTPFDPYSAAHRTNDYCEGNAWQYLWLTPQDPEGLIDLMGGEETFTQKLDSLFTISSELDDNASVDISGMIGQYAHGNEPSHHVAYMYSYAGKQYKTAPIIRTINNTLYTDKPDGLSGNEDCGQMSAWYIFSSIGFYPVNPTNGLYVFGSPLFDEVKINLPQEKQFIIKAENNSDLNIYIQSVKLNGENYNYSYITHKDIMKGGELVFEMGSIPNKSFANDKEFRPKSKMY